MTILVASLTFLLLLLLSTTTARPTKAIPTTLHPTTRLPLLNLDRLSSSEARMRRDAARMAVLVGQVLDDDDDYNRIILGYIPGAAAVIVSIGTPPVDQNLMVDTGSDLLWLQCKSCDECFTQRDPTFDPKMSSSYKRVPCAGSDNPNACDRLDGDNRGCDDNGFCTYNYNYMDESYSKGALALETVTIGDVNVTDMPVGCGLSNKLKAIGVDGILGLGGGTYSFLSKSGSALSYCLRASSGTVDGGWLDFNRSDFPSDGTVWVPRVINRMRPTSYYVGLTGIGVNGERVQGVTADTFRITDGGDGGAIIDTGTTITMLPNDAYVALRDAFRAKMVDRQPSTFDFLDTCYNVSESDTIPTVSLYLSDKSSPSITSKRPLFYVGGGVECLAFTVSSTSLTIIGNIQQQGTRITIDASSDNIGITPDVC
ncbi:Protein ASPARTIC PROTEASE IN GUARD CELL 2 [Striga hermonthica]|uniref:Protein ASPARTIC PROTEASE IN GUARD CELL 2 n=1 Tax=Striga hermonthica TaxID=68872 RepID=A0A9N7R9Z9_STRHE|nr:Protein ASPARTIC PROTEASE IN GUARD CELL 2 [Striga hermonthica]